MSLLFQKTQQHIAVPVSLITFCLSIFFFPIFNHSSILCLFPFSPATLFSLLLLFSLLSSHFHHHALVNVPIKRRQIPFAVDLLLANRTPKFQHRTKLFMLLSFPFTLFSRFHQVLVQLVLLQFLHLQNTRASHSHQSDFLLPFIQVLLQIWQYRLHQINLARCVLVQVESLVFF
jgi:hypothetical protein